jgi:hypothetical protein
MTTRFEELQNEHQMLLERVQPGGGAAGKSSEETLAAVRAYI